MSQPILSIEANKASSSPKSCANLLPCRIQHDGPVDSVGTFWKPTRTGDKNVAYFRGKQLHGKKVHLPEGFRGVVVEKTDKKPEHTQTHAPQGDEENDDVDISRPELGTLQVKSEFDEMMVWDHETLADAATDPYVRGIEEWLQVADKIHSYSYSSSEATEKLSS